MKDIIKDDLKISQVLPLRPPGMTPLFWPSEEGYICPVCQAVGEALYWSEYRGMLWCYVCQKDYPSCLCLQVSEIDKAVDIFLASVQEAVRFATVREPTPQAGRVAGDAGEAG